MDNKKFGDFIKELRKEKQLTQKELGEKLNITDKAISKWERGLSFPDIAVLKDLAEFFEIDISELLNGERGKKQEIDIEKAIKEAIENYKNIEEKEIVKIPNIKLNEKAEFSEIENKPFYLSNGNSYLIEKAIQTIQFELDKTGGKIRSEAGMMVSKTATLLPEELREFVIDDTFAIFLKENGKDKPYFAGKISDITKFQ